VTDAYQKYEFFRVFQTVQNFCVVDLSNFYLDIAKDRLYISAPDAPRRRSCQTVLWIALENLVRAIAPILSHMAEDIWQFLPYATPYKSVFEAGWLKIEEQWHQSELAQEWIYLRFLRTKVNQVLEGKRQEKIIGSSLEAKITICDAVRFPKLEQLNSLEDQSADKLRYLFLTSQVEVIPPKKNPEGLANTDNVLFSKADGHKCDRCWNYSTTVGLSQRHPLLCDRCETVIETGLNTGEIVEKGEGFNWAEGSV
jgi:isoleucyl-tRNA synthetase